MLGQLAVLRAGGTAEEVPRQAEALAELFLDAVLLLAIGCDVLSGFQRRQFGWGAVFVGGADEQRLVAFGTPDAKPDVTIDGGLPALKSGPNRMAFGLDPDNPSDFQVRILATKVYP